MDRLEALGLVRKEIHPSDRRARLLTLTDRGGGAAENARPGGVRRRSRAGRARRGGAQAVVRAAATGDNRLSRSVCAPLGGHWRRSVPASGRRVGRK
ncbi:hypothetical protein HGB38_28040 [Nocardia gamkensis]|uniref:HTH marR-type domain-containing protein n=1 Tax=Nocardia gamkensis TaxID=352869 RepID=A0A7X6L8W9_9NOCA|nr:hypothetical protein [Nocardia gamkensis]